MTVDSLTWCPMERHITWVFLMNVLRAYVVIYLFPIAHITCIVEIQNEMFVQCTLTTSYEGYVAMRIYV